MKPIHKVGEGLERVAWRHPQRDDRVIKIMKPSAKFNRNRSDLEWYQSRNPVVSEHISVLYDITETNFGTSLECELISDEDGTPSKNIRDYVRSGELSMKEARQMLCSFYNWAIAYHMLISDSALGNVLYQRRQKPRLVIVDGFGPGHGIYWSIVKRFRPLIHYSNVRKRRRALRSLAEIAIKHSHITNDSGKNSAKHAFEPKTQTKAAL